MKKISTTVLLILFCTLAQAQIINFPDPVFKAHITQTTGGTGWNPTTMQSTSYQYIDTNGDDEIDQSEAAQITYLNLSLDYFTSLEGIEYFVNLKSLDCDSNYLTELDVSALSQLEALNCGLNQITNLNVSNLHQLKLLYISGNPIIDIDFTGLDSLEFLECGGCPIPSIDFSLLPSLEYFIGVFCPFTSLDFSQNPLLQSLEIEECPNLLSINLKNGSFLFQSFIIPQLVGLQNLQFVCIDEGEEDIVNELFGIVPGEESNIVLSTNCDDDPSLSFYSLQGNGTLDANNNGCDATDEGLAFLKIQITNSSGETRFVYADNDGDYMIYFANNDTYTVTPILENPSFYTVSPESLTLTFPTDNDAFTQNFCITPIGIQQDLSVFMLPYNQNSAGFSSSYIISYKNEGNTIQNGTVSLQFDEAILNLIYANPVQNTINEGFASWNFTNLYPNETRNIFLEILLNSPIDNPPLNAGDVLIYTTEIANETDENPSNNTFVYEQTVVNSYDPNQITCLEGTVIPTDMIGKYLHYLVDFENLGTANAQNIVVRLDIDSSKFDINSLIPLHASHSFVTNLGSDGKLEFVFENIQLPFDDENNDGFMAFKIKSNDALLEYDFVENTAAIYFDFNFPVITNTATTTFQNILSNPIVNADTQLFEIYPNPTRSEIEIKAHSNSIINKIEVYNLQGQRVKIIENAGAKVDVSSLNPGTYFLKIFANDESSVLKLIKI